MALIRTCRSAARSGRPKFVPGGLACAASGKRDILAPTRFRLSPTLKLVSGAMASPLTRLTAQAA